jgi:tetratricopeptide (TPR) repeat protein
VLKVALIRLDLEEAREAKSALQEALDRFRQLLADSPTDLEARIGEATCLERLGQVSEAVALWEALRSERPDDERILQATGDAYNRLGVSLSKEKPLEAMAAHEKSREIRMKLLEQDPDNPKRLSELGQTLNNVASIASQDPARGDDAAALFGQAHEYLDQAHRLSPNDFETARGAAVTSHNRGWSLDVLGRHAEAAEAYRRSAVIYQSLAARHPTLDSVRRQMVNLHLEMSRMYARIGRTRDAALTMRRLREAIENLPAESASELFARCEMRALCATRLEEDDAEGAGLNDQEREEAARAAVADLKSAIVRGFRNVHWLHVSPELDSLRPRQDFQDLVTFLEHTVQLEDIQKKPAAEQAAALEHIRNKLAALAAADPEFGGFQAGVAQTNYALGAAKLALGDKAAAERQFDQARRILEPLVKAQPNTLEYLVSLASVRRRLGVLWWENQRYVEAKNSWSETRQLLDEGLAKHPQEPTLTRALAMHEYELAVLFAEYGHWSLAHEHWEASRGIERYLPPMWEGRLAALDALVDTPEEFAQRCQDLVQRFGEKRDTHFVWATGLRPDAGLPVDRWRQLGEDAERAFPQHGRNEHGRIQLWTGDVEPALPKLFRYLTVTAYAKLGRMSDAQAKFQEEEQFYKNAWNTWLIDRPDGGLRKFTDAEGWGLGWNDPKKNYWWEAVALSVARREAWPLVEGRPAVDPWRHLLEAKIWTRMGEPERAAEAFGRAVEITPSDPEAWFLRAEYCETQGDFDQALADLQKAVELSTDTARYRTELGKYYARRGEPALAESTLRAVGNDSDALAALGRQLLAEGRPAEAVQPLQEMLKSRRDTLGLDHAETQSGMFALARVHFEAGQWNEACLVLEELLSQRVKQFGVESQEALVVRHILLRLYQTLAAPLEEEFRRDPQRAINIARRMSDVDLRQMGGAAKFNLGALLYRNGECAQTLDCLDGVLGGGGLTGGTHLYQAMAHWRLQNPEEARRIFAHGVSVFLARPAAAPYTAAWDEAKQLLELGPDEQYEATLQVLDQAIQAEPLMQFLWVRRGAVQFKLNRFAEALADYKRAAELTPSDCYAWAGQIQALHTLGRDAEIRPLIADAVSKIEAGLGRDPVRVSRTYDFAWHLARIVPEIWGSVDETAAFLEEASAFSQDRGSFELLFVDAAWRLREGDHTGYKQVCQKAAEQRDPMNARQLYLLARMAALSPDTPLPAADLVVTARDAVSRDALNVHQHALALALLRDGQYLAAMEAAQTSLEQNHLPVTNWMVQSLAHYHLGHHQVARRLAERTRVWTVLATEFGVLHAHERLAAELLRGEVESLILGETVKPAAHAAAEPAEKP